jgi:quercetin dioxygenase-like cupin family protein
MKGGAILKEHKAEGGVSILVLRGRIRIKVDANDVELGQSQMMVLNPGARHSVEALEEAAFLISISG